MTGADPARAAARGRHPSARSPVPTGLLAARVLEAIAGAGALLAAVAAAVLADRGLVGATVDEYARSLGVDAGTVERAESGALAPDELPAPLRRVVAASPAPVR